MKKLINGNQALCLNCQTTEAVVHTDGSVRCSNCFRMMLIDKKTKEVFVPVFADKTFTASPYTPPVKDRRKTKGKVYPKIRERRRTEIFHHKRGVANV